MRLVIAAAGRAAAPGARRRLTALCVALAALAASGAHAPASADRLRLIVTPAQVRPGGFANVRVSDSSRRGAISARICASSGGRSLPCTPIRLGAGVRRVRVRLPRTGRWTIALRSVAGRTISRHVAVRRDARPRIVVTGDSMVLGVHETIARDLGRGRSVTGDPHSSTGISKPDLFDWPAHARRSEPADATVVFLGAADGGYPLVLSGGATVPCCGPAWVAEYARRIAGMMTSYLRGGRGLVYWTLLPAPRSPARAEVFRAIDAAARAAAGTFGDGVRLVGTVADVLAPQGRYTETIVFKGRRRVVRERDGIHLATAGIHIASAIIVRALRRDGLLG